MRFVSIDPATSTGWACFVARAAPGAVRRSHLELVAHGHFRVTAGATSAHGERCLELERHVEALLDALVADGPIEHVFIEDYFFSSRACNGVTLNVKFRAVIEMCVCRRALPYTLVHPGRWFATVVGSVPKRTPTRERKALTALALERAYGIVIPSREGRRATPSDVYDAIAIGVHGIAGYIGVPIAGSATAASSADGAAADGAAVERGDNGVVAA